MADSSRPKITASRIALLAGASLITFLVIAALLAMSRAKSALDAEISRIRSAGEPLTLEEMLPELVPDDENGILLFLAAMESLAKAGPPPDRKDVEACTIYLGDIGDVPARLRDAAERPGWRYPSDPVGVFMQGSGLRDYRRASEVLAMDARAALEGGDLARAEGDVLAILGIADSVTQVPLTLSYLIRSSSGRTAAEILKGMLGDERVPPAACLRLADEAEAWRSRDVLTRCLMGERCYVLQVFGVLSAGGGGGRWPWSRTFLRLDAAEYIRCMGRVIAISRLPYPEAEESSRSLIEELDDHPFVTGTARVGIPNILETVRHRAQDQARWGALVIALRIKGEEEGRQENPLDPFTGKPFIVRRDEDGVLIYSVGPDLVDDGGVEGRDIIVRIP